MHAINARRYLTAWENSTWDTSKAENRFFWQQEDLQKTLRWATKTAYGKGRSISDLSTWPILTKEMLRSNSNDFISGCWPTLPAATSGSSGSPLRLVRSLENIAMEQAFLDSLIAPYNFKNSKIAVLRGDVVKATNDTTPPFGVYRDKRYLQLSAAHLSPTTISWFADELERFAPDVLWIYPTAGDYLASLLAQQNNHISIPVVFSSSEMLTMQSWHRLKNIFGGDVIDYYGQAERVCLSYCRSPDESWFHGAYGYVELQPVTVSGLDEGEAHAEIIATGFWNRAMPLVRYATGDRIAYPAAYTKADLKDVAIGKKPFLRVVGRQTEYLITPEGGRIQALNNIPREVDHILRVQFIQENVDQVDILVQPTAKYTPPDGEKLIANARRRIPESISLHLIDDQPLRMTKGGKTPFLIRTVNDQ